MKEDKRDQSPRDRAARSAIVQKAIDRGLAKVLEVERDGIVANRLIESDWGKASSAEDHEVLFAAFNACQSTITERLDGYADAAAKVLQELGLPTALGFYDSNGVPFDYSFLDGATSKRDRHAYARRPALVERRRSV